MLKIEGRQVSRGIPITVDIVDQIHDAVRKTAARTMRRKEGFRLIYVISSYFSQKSGRRH